MESNLNTLVKEELKLKELFTKFAPFIHEYCVLGHQLTVRAFITGGDLQKYNSEIKILCGYAARVLNDPSCNFTRDGKFTISKLFLILKRQFELCRKLFQIEYSSNTNLAKFKNVPIEINENALAFIGKYKENEKSDINLLYQIYQFLDDPVSYFGYENQTVVSQEKTEIQSIDYLSHIMCFWDELGLLDYLKEKQKNGSDLSLAKLIVQLMHLEDSEEKQKERINTIVGYLKKLRNTSDLIKTKNALKTVAKLNLDHSIIGHNE